MEAAILLDVGRCCVLVKGAGMALERAWPELIAHRGLVQLFASSSSSDALHAWSRLRILVDQSGDSFGSTNQINAR